jgi:hypothetical protein
MTYSSKIIFCNSQKFQICFLGLCARQTGFMSGNTFNTFPLPSKNPSYTLAYPFYSSPGQIPLLGWLNILSISRHKSRSKFQKNGWKANLFLPGRLMKSFK